MGAESQGDPYTTNLVLRNALKSIANVDAAGSIVTKIAVPIPTVVVTTATVGDLVWSKDPDALRKLNEERVRALGAPEKYALAFFRNGWCTLTLQTRIVAALDAVKKPGCADYLESAATADTEREALFFVESAEMLQRYHARTPVDRAARRLARDRGRIERRRRSLGAARFWRSTSAGRTASPRSRLAPAAILGCRRLPCRSPARSPIAPGRTLSRRLDHPRTWRLSRAARSARTIRLPRV